MARPESLRLARPSVGRGTDRIGSLVEFLFRAQAALVYVFLYAPILVVVLFAFNDTRGVAAPS